MTPIDDLTRRVQSYDPTVAASWLHAVYDLANAAHQGQQRASGESYIEHPLAVARILADMEMDRATIAAAILHDVVEDTVVTGEEVAAKFGSEIAQLVEGVTKPTRIPYQSKEDAQVENLRKMFMAMAKDIRVIIIKLADRLHNMRTLQSLPADKQQAIARETVEIYAPIAHRLGMWKVKWDLEDLCLRYLDPDAYRDISERVAKKRAEREAAIENIVTILRQQFGKVDLTAEVRGRPKHFFSIYTKMKKGREFSTIYDLTAVRIIVDNVRTATVRWASYIRFGNRSPAASKITSRCPSPTCISRCTRPSSGRAAIRSRFRSVPRKCTAPASTASPRIGVIRKAASATSSRTS